MLALLIYYYHYVQCNTVTLFTIYLLFWLILLGFISILPWCLFFCYTCMVSYHNWQPFWVFIINNTEQSGSREACSCNLNFFFGNYCRGTRIKTRKRNIAAPLDPASFSDAIVQIYVDNGGDLVRPSLGVPFSIYCFNQ